MIRTGESLVDTTGKLRFDVFLVHDEVQLVLNHSGRKTGIVWRVLSLEGDRLRLETIENNKPTGKIHEVEREA